MIHKMLQAEFMILMLALSAKAQTAMTVIGPQGRTVPMYETNAISAPIVKELLPGEEVSAFESQFGWTRVRLADGRTGYVSSFSLSPKPVPQQQPEPATPAAPTAPTAATQQPAARQPQPPVATPRVDRDEFPRAEIFGGYSIVSLDGEGVIDRQIFQGWAASVTGNINRTFGIAVIAGGNYGTLEETVFVGSSPVLASADIKHHGVAIGPEISYRNRAIRAFVHGAVGMVHTKADNVAGSANGIKVVLTELRASETDLSWVIGGGMDLGSASIAARLFQLDYIGAKSDPITHNFRIAVGIVGRF